MKRSVVLLVAALLLSAAPLVAQDVPFLTGRVVDDANILDQAARDRVTAVLKAHEDSTTNQIVVLTLPTIGSTSVEEYAVKVFEAWKLGQKDKDNGILVVVVPNDRKMRIEVGYGLEGTIPDGAAGEIIRKWMTPAFKAGDYNKGIEDGVAAIVSRLEGRGDPSDRTPAAASSSSGTDGFTQLPWPQRLLIGAFIYSIIGMFTVIGVMTPGVGWFLYVFLIPFWALFPLVIIGPMNTMIQLAVYLIGFPIAKQTLKKKAWYQKAAGELKSKGKTSIGGFSVTKGSRGSSWSSGSSSGSSWSSSSSGSSFSGGGGSSGGGGASGSW